VRVSLATAIALGAAAGLALGIVVSVATDLPLAPEVGLALGALAGWLSRRRRGQATIAAIPARIPYGV
jgi:Flp pilus assembly protein TadB